MFSQTIPLDGAVSPERKKSSFVRVPFKEKHSSRKYPGLFQVEIFICSTLSYSGWVMQLLVFISYKFIKLKGSTAMSHLRF